MQCLSSRHWFYLNLVMLVFVSNVPTNQPFQIFNFTDRSSVMPPKKITIIGSGVQGTNIARIVGATVREHPNDFDSTVRMWMFDETDGGKLLSNTRHENVKYLPGTILPQNVLALSNLDESCREANILFFTVRPGAPDDWLRKVREHSSTFETIVLVLQVHKIDRNMAFMDLLKKVDKQFEGINVASCILFDEPGKIAAPKNLNACLVFKKGYTNANLEKLFEHEGVTVQLVSTDCTYRRADLWELDKRTLKNRFGDKTYLDASRLISRLNCVSTAPSHPFLDNIEEVGNSVRRIITVAKASGTGMDLNTVESWENDLQSAQSTFEKSIHKLVENVRIRNSASSAPAERSGLSNGVVPDATSASSANIRELYELAHSLKYTKRNVLAENGIHSIPVVTEGEDSVSHHFARIAVLAIALEGQIKDLDVQRAVRMSLVHDSAEAFIGDKTPHGRSTEEHKHTRELTARKKIAEMVPALCDDWLEFWKEYEGNKTLTAMVANHLDKFDVTSQAYSYEKKYGIDLSQFFETTRSSFTMEPFVSWNKEMIERRSKEKQNA